MSGYQGNIIIKNPATPTGPYEDGAAPGVWTLSEAMTFVKQGVWPTAGLASPDPYFKNVSLLLHGNGTNGAQNNTFTNSATGGGVSADQGIPIQGSFSPYGSNWSNYFDGSGDYLEATGAALAVGSGSWTVEGWIFLNAYPASYAQIFDTRFDSHGTSTGLTLYVGSTGTLRVYQDGDRAYTSATITRNTWTHFAAVYDGSTLKLYLNGSNTGATNYTTSFNLTNTTIQVGCEWTKSAGFINAYISNFRVVKSAVYTSAFTPSTTPLTAITNTSLLTCQSNRFRDASTNNFTITRVGDTKVLNFAPFAPSSAYSTTTNGGSAYFDPNNLDRLNITFNYYVGNTDFTWEGWAYLTTTASPKPLFSGKIGGSNIGFDLLFENGGRALQIITSTDDVYTVAAASNINLHCWNHIALSRTSGTLSVYVNGVRTYNAGFSDTMANSFNLRIGGTYDYYGESWYYFPGYLSDVRYSKTGRYSGTTITVPTAPLTNDANTLGLLNFTNAGIFDNSMHNNLRTVGNAQISTSVKKFGTGSIYLDGTGDYLTLPDDLSLRMGSGNFTIEFWWYPISLSGYQTPFEKGYTSSGGLLLQTGAGDGRIVVYASGSAVITASTAPTLNTWSHMALVRNGTSLVLYLNGTSVGSATNSTNFNSTSVVGVGANVSGGGAGAYPINGYMDDFRITNGVARYTANFTPPTKAFPDT